MQLASDPPLVTWTCAGVAPGYMRGDRPRSSTRAVGLRIAERLGQQRLSVAFAVDELLDAQRMDAAFARFQATRFSQIDWSRSSAKASKLHPKKCSSPHRPAAAQLGYSFAPHGFDGPPPGSARSRAGDHPRRPFIMGSDDGEEDERPSHVVDLDAFQIGVQPVTNAEYARFVRESGHRAPSVHAAAARRHRRERRARRRLPPDERALCRGTKATRRANGSIIP